MCEGPHPKTNWDRMYENDCGECKYLLARYREMRLGHPPGCPPPEAERLKKSALLKVFVVDAKKHFDSSHPEWPRG